MLELALRHAFADLELDIGFRSAARTVALFGDSGAGKTSVLNAIAGLLAPREGRIVLDGEVLLDTARGRHVPTAARRLGYVFQDGRLFPHLDVRANLLYGAPGRRMDADFANVVALLELQPLLARRPLTLSGGERQRVAIGRALLARPRALLLDEPLTGLHEGARRQVLDHLQRLKQELGLFTVLVSHRADEVASLADEIILLASGRVTGQMQVATFRARYATSQAPADALRNASNWIG
ncbi:MAG: ATP-binding cassette domain-containing protein [Dokdonella sp.]|nr:ATP-binding cassette domain-containing protein [Dokdonella sp.]